MKRKELTPEQREHRRLRTQKYYREHREQILAYNREDYRQKGRAWNAERARKYRQTNREAYLAKCQEYRANHREYFRRQNQNYRQQHRVSISRKTIHRCAYMGYSYVEAYLAKLIRIYLICAIIIFPDAQNLCRENNLRELNLDQLPYVQV